MIAMTPTLAIIGGGYAGLACAVEAARQGLRVTLFERSLTLGGRARRVSQDGWHVDNGQHILIGAYTELTRMLRITRVSPRTLEHLPLTLHVPGAMHLQTSASLPAPLHLAVGLMRARGLDWRDRAAALRFVRHLRGQRFRISPDTSVAELCARTQQTPKLIRHVWEPLCAAALNTPFDEASAQVFVNVIHDALLGNASASELLLPRVDLSELFPVPAGRFLAVNRGRIQVGCTIEGIRIEPRGRGFLLDGDSEKQRFSDVVIATAPYHAGALLACDSRCAPLAAQIDAFRHEPISTVYLQYDAAVRLPHAMIGLADGPVQWAFDRHALGGPPGLIAGVISTAAGHLGMGRSELEQAAHGQLQRALGRPLAKPRRTLTITEKRATLACTPALRRPGIRTPVAGLWLAGDYLDSPYPATLESAVHSGVAVAQAIVRGYQAQQG